MYLIFINRLVDGTNRIKNGSVIATAFNLFYFLDMFVANNHAFLTGISPHYFKKLQSLLQLNLYILIQLQRKIPSKLVQINFPYLKKYKEIL